MFPGKLPLTIRRKSLVRLIQINKMQENLNEQQFYSVGWCIIPPTVIGRKDLTPSEKIAFGRILSLIQKTGYCFASNAWIGSQIGLKRGTVANLISKLQRKKLVRIEIVRDENKKVIERKIYPLFTEQLIPPHSEMNTPPHSGVKEENTVISNTEESKPIHSKMNTHRSMEFLLNIPLEDIKKLQEEVNASDGQIRGKGEELYHYCQSKGKRYSNYYSFLRNALVKDFPVKKRSGERVFRIIPE